MYPPNKTLEFTKLQVSLRQLIINHHKSANISYKSHEISLFLWFSCGFPMGFPTPREPSRAAGGPASSRMRCGSRLLPGRHRPYSRAEAGGGVSAAGGGLTMGKP